MPNVSEYFRLRDTRYRLEGTKFSCCGCIVIGKREVCPNCNQTSRKENFSVEQHTNVPEGLMEQALMEMMLAGK